MSSKLHDIQNLSPSGRPLPFPCLLPWHPCPCLPAHTHCNTTSLHHLLAYLSAFSLSLECKLLYCLTNSYSSFQVKSHLPFKSLPVCFLPPSKAKLFLLLYSCSIVYIILLVLSPCVIFEWLYSLKDCGLPKDMNHILFT